MERGLFVVSNPYYAKHFRGELPVDPQLTTCSSAVNRRFIKGHEALFVPCCRPVERRFVVFVYPFPCKACPGQLFHARHVRERNQTCKKTALQFSSRNSNAGKKHRFKSYYIIDKRMPTCLPEFVVPCPNKLKQTRTFCYDLPVWMLHLTWTSHVSLQHVIFGFF